MNMHMWIIIGLTMVTAGGIVHVFIYPYLSGDINAEKRQAALRPTAPKRGAESQADAASRRKQITESIKELEARGKRKKQSLEMRIAQAGLSWSRNKYIGASLASAAFFGGLIWLFRANPIVIVAAMSVGGFGFPAWILEFLAQAPFEEIRQRISQCGRHYYPGRQGGTAARRLPAGHRDGSGRAGPQRIPPDRRGTGHGLINRRGRRANSRTCPDRGGELLRDRYKYSAKSGRQSCRSAGQSVVRAARTKKNERKNQSDVR